METRIYKFQKIATSRHGALLNISFHYAYVVRAQDVVISNVRFFLNAEYMDRALDAA